MRGELQIRGWRTRKRNKPVKLCKVPKCNNPAQNQFGRLPSPCKKHYMREWYKKQKPTTQSVWREPRLGPGSPLQAIDGWEFSSPHLVSGVCPVCGAPAYYAECLLCSSPR